MDTTLFPDVDSSWKVCEKSFSFVDFSLITVVSHTTFCNFDMINDDYFAVLLPL